MRRSSAAFKRSTTSYSGQDISKAYLGRSSICRLVGKTEEGKVIEDSLKEESASTASPRKLLFAEDIMAAEQFLKLRQNATSHSIVLQKWHGYIDKIEGDEFTAILTDPSGRTADIKASFSIDEVSEGDRDLVCENAFFDWVVSRERKSHGQIENKDFLVFRRFPMWKKSDLEARSDKVDAFDEWLNSSTSR